MSTKSSRTSSLTHDYASALIARCASVGSSALVTLLTARLLTTADRGIYVLLSTLVTMLWTVGNFGFGLGSTFHAGQQTFSLHTLRTNARLAAIILGALLAAAGYVIATIGFEMFRGVTPQLAVIAVMGVPAIMGAQFLGAVLLGAQRIREYNQLLIAYSVAQLVFIGTACLIARTLEAAVIASLAANVLWFVSSSWMTRRWSVGDERTTQLRWDAARAVVAYGLRGQVGNIVQLLNYRLDFFLVSAFLGTSALGIYSVAVMVAEALWQLSNSMALVLFPRVAALGDSVAEQRRIVSTAARIALLITLVAATGLALTVQWWMTLVFGAQYAPASAALLLLLPGVALFTVTVILSSGIAGAGHPERNSYVAAATLVVSVALDLWLIPRLGVPGAALASTLTYTLSTYLTVRNYVRLSGADLRDIIRPRPDDLRMVVGALRRLAGLSPSSSVA